MINLEQFQVPQNKLALENILRIKHSLEKIISVYN